MKRPDSKRLRPRSGLWEPSCGASLSSLPQRLEDQRVGAPISIANEFSEIRVSRVETRNGSRLLIESPRSGQWVALDPLELEALTWQTTATFSAMIAQPFAPMFPEITPEEAGEE